MQNEKVCGVVISYRPSTDIATNVLRLREQVGSVIVVDNSPGYDGSEVLRDLEGASRCEIIRNHGNLGIAAALNIGIRRGISRGFSWIVTLDQDSRIGDGYVDAMLAGYHEAEIHGKIGILCPQYRDARLGVILPAPRATNGELFGCLTSGAMLHESTFTAMGPLEERLFIDYVDHEYCLRLRSAGYKIVECREAVLDHSLGRISYKTLLGRKISTTNHSPRRRYYIYRNRLVLIQRYLLKDREWALRELKGMVKDSVKIVLLEEKKASKAWYIMRALFDGLFGRLGPRVDL